VADTLRTEASLDRLVERAAFGLVLQDRQHGRGVDDHQRGTPWSS
jgi:hypothetical protein